MSRINRIHRTNLDNETAKQFLTVVKSMTEKQVAILTKTIEELENGSNTFQADRYGNERIKDYKDILNRIYDLLVEAPDEFTLGPMPTEGRSTDAGDDL